MNKVLLMIALLLGGLATSCGGEDQEENEAQNASENRIKGTWKVVKAEGDIAEINIGNLYIFEQNKVTLKGSGITTSGTYSTRGDTLVFAMDRNTGFTYLHEIKGKQLVIKPVGSDQVLYLERQAE